MIAEEMGKIEMDYDCRGVRGDRGSRNGNWNSNDKWQQLQKRAQPKMPQIIGTKRYKRKRNKKLQWKVRWAEWGAWRGVKQE